MKIDKVNDEFIVDCTNNTTEEKQQVYKFLVDNRDYGMVMDRQPFTAKDTESFNQSIKE